MKVDRRLLSRLVVTAALAALIAFLVPVFVDRRDFARAVTEYVKNSTPENEAVMERESREPADRADNAFRGDRRFVRGDKPGLVRGRSAIRTAPMS
ncbi:MAG TPA: hypothetical protein VJW51_13390 [Candidatus Acidoferrales bacterium]|nr:hypothetical protein [Candidatus Acidoferrales bacterium]